jgi:hypothetical protein
MDSSDAGGEDRVKRTRDPKVFVFRKSIHSNLGLAFQRAQQLARRDVN